VALEPFTVDHFRRYAELLVFDDGERREPEQWQLDVVKDVFAGFKEVWQIVPEGNGKSTFLSVLALYGADYVSSPWIPIGAASAKQARIIYDQATGFVERTEGMDGRFQCFGGYKLIRSLRNGGIGIEVFAADVKTGDGVIPYPYALLDELHRQDDLRLYRLWKGKLRKRGAQLLSISTAGEPETPFENTRDEIRRRATKRKRTGSHLRAEGPGLVLHEWMVPTDALCGDMEAVKAANPLSSITAATLGEDFASPTMDLGDWKRLKCNRPTRSVQTAITDKEWEEAEVDLEIPAGAAIDVGLDIASTPRR
jgi:phage terminase large subunit-like protein